MLITKKATPKIISIFDILNFRPKIYLYFERIFLIYFYIYQIFNRKKMPSEIVQVL